MDSNAMTLDNLELLPISSLRWLLNRFKLDGMDRPITFRELEQLCDDVPEFWTQDIDAAYREGFQEGFSYCISVFCDLHTKGEFFRVNEIANILDYWSSHVLMHWRFRGEGKHLNESDHHPNLKQESWKSIRERILRRDGQCVRCGDVLKLEVDHIQEVQDGGLPTDDNLQTLCVVCHRGKKHWANEQ